MPFKQAEGTKYMGISAIAPTTKAAVANQDPTAPTVQLQSIWCWSRPGANSQSLIRICDFDADTLSFLEDESYAICGSAFCSWFIESDTRSNPS